MLSLYISEVLGSQSSLVSSAETPAPIPFPDQTYSDVVDAEIFIVDGSGGYSAASGASGSTVTVSIGELDIAVWSSSSWNIDSGPPAGWTGQLALQGNALLALFQGRDSIVLKVQVKITDASGDSRTYLSMPITILNSMAPSAAISSLDGQFAIPSGVDSVDVTGLGLQAVPRRVLVSQILKPAGGLNIFGTVDKDSITTDGFTVDLSGQADMAGYILVYELIFG